MLEGRTKKAAINVTFNLANQILTLILSFVSRTVFIWGLGAEYLGINGLFSDVLNLLSMADLGFGTAMVYSFYKPLADKDYKKMAGLTTFYKKIYTIIAMSVAVIGLALTPALPYLINLDTSIPHITLYYWLSLANVVFSYLCVYKTSILNADQQNYITVRISIIVNVVRSILQIVAIILWKSYTVYLLLGCISVLINNIVASRKATKKYPFIIDKVQLSSKEKKSIFTNVGSVFLYKVSSVLMNATTNLIISIVIGTLAVGYYSNYLLLQNKISMFYTLIFTSLTASIGNLIVKERAEKRYEIFQCEQSVSFIVCGIVIPCYVVLVNDLINVWLGEEFLLSRLCVYAIGLNMYLGCVLQPLWSYREATGLYRKTKWVMVLCAGLNLVFAIVFGYTVGLAGILFASSLARLLTYIWYEPKLLFREYFDTSAKIYYFQLLSNLLLIIVLILIVGKISELIIVVSFLSWIAKGIVVGCLTAVITIGFYWKSEGVKNLISKVMQFMKR